jgi:hypothetical protein
MRSDSDPRPEPPRVTKPQSSLESIIVALLGLSFLALCYATYLIATGSPVVGYEMLAGVAVIMLLSYLFTAQGRARRRRRY